MPVIKHSEGCDQLETTSFILRGHNILSLSRFLPSGNVGLVLTDILNLREVYIFKM